MKVKTTQPVQFDGKDLDIGTVIEVSTAAGNQLIEAGSAELVGKAKREGESGADGGAGDAGGATGGQGSK